MIDLYYYRTPNGRKPLIMLEETGLPYRLRIVDIRRGDQFTPEFLAISPNNRMPAIVDHDGPGGEPISVFESGAILLYLARKTGRFLPQDPARRWVALQWLCWQVAEQGPMAGQATHFTTYAPDRGIVEDFAQRHFHDAIARVYAELDRQLAGRDYIADEYSIADMANFPWCRTAKGHGIAIEDYPNVAAWVARVGDRPAVKKKPPDETDMKTVRHDDEAWHILFGSGQAAAGRN
jgi:GST-like protein